MQSNSGVIDRALIQLAQNKVSSIESGGSLLDSVSVWPQNIPDEEAIKVNDQTDEVYQKLVSIYQIPEYRSYQIILPDKPLDKPYDTDMANYKEWAFEFSEQIGAEKTGNNSVRLYFENNKLVKIENEYSEHQMVH